MKRSEIWGGPRGGASLPRISPTLMRATAALQARGWILQQLELAVFRLAARERAALMRDEALLHVAQERRGRKPAQPAAPVALLGAAQDQALLRPRHADVEQPALLRQGRFVGLAPMQRKEAVLEPDDEDDREFEPLRCVQRQQRHAVGARIEELCVGRERG